MLGTPFATSADRYLISGSIHARMSVLKPAFSTCFAVGLRSAVFFLSRSSISWLMNSTSSASSATAGIASRALKRSRLVGLRLEVLVMVSTSFIFYFQELPSLDYIVIIAHFLVAVKRFFQFFLASPMRFEPIGSGSSLQSHWLSLLTLLIIAHL